MSGGYGLIRVEEPIHWYEAHLQRTHTVWSRRIPVILRDYVARHGIHRTFGVFSRDYAKVVPSGLSEEDWRCVPRWTGQGSAQVEVPARVGQGLTALLATLLDGSWTPPSGWHRQQEC